MVYFRSQVVFVTPTTAVAARVSRAQRAIAPSVTACAAQRPARLSRRPGVRWTPASKAVQIAEAEESRDSEKLSGRGFEAGRDWRRVVMFWME